MIWTKKCKGILISFSFMPSKDINRTCSFDPYNKIIEQNSLKWGQSMAGKFVVFWTKYLGSVHYLLTGLGRNGIHVTVLRNQDTKKLVTVIRYS